MREKLRNIPYLWPVLASLCFQAAFVVCQYVVGKGDVYGWVENGIRVGLLFLLFRGLSLRDLKAGPTAPSLLFALFIALSLIRYNTLHYDLAGFSLAYVLLFLKDFVLYFLLVKALLAYVRLEKFPAPRPPEVASGRHPLPHPAFWALFFMVFLGLCMQWRAFYFPARNSPDTLNQWNQIHTGTYHDLHAIGHTFFLKFLSLFMDSQGFVVLVQLILVAGLTALLGQYLHRRGVPFLALVILTTLYQCLLLSSFYMYPWKDVAYGLALGLVTYFILRAVEGDLAFNWWRSLILGGALAWMMLFRQNGVVPLLFCALWFLWYFIKGKKWLSLGLTALAAACCFLLVWVIAYRILRVESPANGYALQVFGSGIAAVVARGGRIAPELMARIEALLPVDFLRAAYEPWNTRTLIWGSETFPDIGYYTYLAKDPLEVIRIYLALIPGNLPILLKDVMYNTYEVWGVMYLFSNATLLVLWLIAMVGAWNREILRRRWAVLIPVAANMLSIAISTITNEIRYLLPTYMLFVPLLLYILYAPRFLPAADQKSEDF